MTWALVAVDVPAAGRGVADGGLPVGRAGASHGEPRRGLACAAGVGLP